MRPGGCGRERARWCDDVVGRCPSRTQEEPLSRDGAVSVTDGRDRSLTHTHTHRLTVTPTRQEATHARREACTPLRSVLSDALQTTSASMGRSAGSQPPIVTARPMFSLRLQGPGRSASFNPEQQSGAQLPILSPKARSSPRSVPKGPIPLPDRSTPHPGPSFLPAGRASLPGKGSPLARKGCPGAPRRRSRSPALEVEQCSPCPRRPLGSPVAVKSWSVAANSCPVAGSFTSRGHRDCLPEHLDPLDPLPVREWC